MSRFEAILSKLKKLGIVGLNIKEVNSVEQELVKDKKSMLLWTIEQILGYSSKLRIISLRTQIFIVEFYEDLKDVNPKLL